MRPRGAGKQFKSVTDATIFAKRRGAYTHTHLELNSCSIAIWECNSDLYRWGVHVSTHKAAIGIAGSDRYRWRMQQRSISLESTHTAAICITGSDRYRWRMKYRSRLLGHDGWHNKRYSRRSNTFVAVFSQKRGGLTGGLTRWSNKVV